jgi:hypothetical protein
LINAVVGSQSEVTMGRVIGEATAGFFLGALLGFCVGVVVIGNVPDPRVWFFVVFTVACPFGTVGAVHGLGLMVQESMDELRRELRQLQEFREPAQASSTQFKAQL